MLPRDVGTPPSAAEQAARPPPEKPGCPWLAPAGRAYAAAARDRPSTLGVFWGSDMCPV